MKGKVGFVLGAALGYVLGTRAGRARYEQIKRGATAVWETPLVQQRVDTLKGAVNEGVELGKNAAAQLMKNAFAAATQQGGNHNARSHSSSSASAPDRTANSSAPQTSPAEEKSE